MLEHRYSPHPRSFNALLLCLCTLLVHTYADFILDPSCGADTALVKEAIAEAQSMAQNAHDLTFTSLNNPSALSREQVLRIALNYAPWFGDGTTTDAQGNPQDVDQ